MLDVKLKKIPGIYQIRNIINNKIYIGSTVNLYDRLHTHKTYLKSNKHHNKHLQLSFNKYGKENFRFEVIEEFKFPNEYSNKCKNEYIECREQYYIDIFKTTNRKLGYNKRIDATSNSGLKRSEETKEKLREIFTGFKHTEEAKRKISEAGKGRTFTKETRNKMSKSKRGKESSFTRKVIDTNTNIIYNSILEASRIFNINRQTLRQWLLNTNPNKSSLKFYSDVNS